MDKETDSAGSLHLGTRLELFVDDTLIDEMNGLTQELHNPVPRAAAIVVDGAWESPHLGYPTVFADGDTFKMYYRAMEASKTDSWPSGTAYAENRDGITWTKPQLGIADFRGSRANNLVWNTGQGTNPSGGINLCPFKDANPAGNRSQDIGPRRTFAL